jgi:hypothetical protein
MMRASLAKCRRVSVCFARLPLASTRVNLAASYEANRRRSRQRNERVPASGEEKENMRKTMKNALMVAGGWEGHEPQKCVL